MKASEAQVTAAAADAGKRLDVVLAAHLRGLSRSQAGKLAQQGAVLLQGAPVKASHRVRSGEAFEVSVPGPTAAPAAEDLPLTIIHEDPWLLVVDKPRGLVVHPAPGAPTGTLVNALLSRGHSLSQLGGEERPGIVHRLDRHTSGLLLVAKDDATHAALKAQLARREVTKVYLALVNGVPSPPAGRLDAPLGRHPTQRQKRAVVTAGGREALTEYETLEVLPPFALVEARPRTGRTHQLRVHLAHAHCPLVGDSTYGGRKQALTWAHRQGDDRLVRLLEALSGQALHAHELAFTHPQSGERVHFKAPLPADLSQLLDHLRHRAI